MEQLDVELGSECGLRLGARARPGHVTDLIAACLTGLRAIAFDLALRSRAGEASGGHHIVGRLFAAPALGVDAGVDHQPRRAEQERLEVAGALQRRRIGAELLGELFGIQRPAFRIGREETDLAQRRNVLRFLRKADLQMMARHALMIGERGQRIFRPVADILQINEIDGGARPVERGAVVIAVRRAILNLDRHGADFERLRGHRGKGLREFGVHRLDPGIEPRDQLGTALGGVGIDLVGFDVELRQPRADGAFGIALRPQDRVELRGDLGDLREADLVNFVGGHRRSRRLGERHRIDRIAIWHTPDAVARLGGGL